MEPWKAPALGQRGKSPLPLPLPLPFFLVYRKRNPGPVPFSEVHTPWPSPRVSSRRFFAPPGRKARGHLDLDLRRRLRLFGAGPGKHFLFAGGGHVLRAKSSGSLRGTSKAGDSVAVHRPKTQALASRLLYDHEHPPCPCSFSSKSRRLAPTRTQHHSTRVCGVLVHKEAPTEPPKGQPSSPQGPGTSSRHFMDA